MLARYGSRMMSTLTLGGCCINVLLEEKKSAAART